MLVDDWKDKFLGQLNDLPPEGYRKFITSLLEAAGFQDVVANDRISGNQVSGSGIYRASLFGFKVKFLSLRKQAVTKRHFHALESNIRTHRERGLLIATESVGNKLRDYSQKVSRSSIDVVDGYMLCEVCRNRRHGLTVTTHAVDKVETDLRDFAPLAGQTKDGPGFTPGLPQKKVAPARGKAKYGDVFIPSMNKPANVRYCEAWQHMANKIYEDNRRDLCGELLEQGIISRRKLIAESKEGLSASTQEQGCFYTLEIGEHVWLIDYGLSNKEKRKFLKQAADYAGFSFGKGMQIYVGF